MGNSYGRYETATEDDEENEDRHRKKKTKKGKRKSDIDAESSAKKIAKLDTPKYVHEKLFLQGEGSDVTVCAIGHMWNLHKLYLKQCKYFEALFRDKSDWKERNERRVNLEFPDGKVSVEALHLVLGSLYSNEIALDICEIEGILSAASLLQLESLLDRCGELMINDIKDETVLSFLNLAITYGLPTVIKHTSNYLTINFWRLSKSNKFLLGLPMEALARLLSSPDTLIMEGEQDLYYIVKKWIYLNNGGKHEDDEVDSEAEKNFFLKNRLVFDRYLALWSGIRLHHLVTSTGSMSILEEDKIFPKRILKEAIVDSWKSLIKNEEDSALSASITDDHFNLCCLRQGRLIDNEPKCWRWTGYNGGVDVLMNFSHGLVTLKRNAQNRATPYSVNLHPQRTIHYRIVITDAKGLMIHDSERQKVSLNPDQLVTVVRLEPGYLLPISVHVFHLSLLPPKPAFLYINKRMKRLLEKRDQQVGMDSESSCSSSTD